MVVRSAVPLTSRLCAQAVRVPEQVPTRNRMMITTTWRTTFLCTTSALPAVRGSPPKAPIGRRNPLKGPGFVLVVRLDASSKRMRASSLTMTRSSTRLATRRSLISRTLLRMTIVTVRTPLHIVVVVVGPEVDEGGGRVGRGPPRSPEHGETETHVKRHRLNWLKGGTREIDPMLSGDGYTGRTRLTLYGYSTKGPLDFFEHCWPPLVGEIAVATSHTGQRTIRPGFNVSEGEMWLYLAEKSYMNVFPQEGPKEHYWRVPEEAKEDLIYVEHDLGRFGHDSKRYREIERAFTLPTYGRDSDFFDPVRKLVDSWNSQMEAAIEPGPVLTVDESMAGWKGKGMPGLMTVPRKPTPVGREAHTTADAQTGVIIHYEM